MGLEGAVIRTYRRLWGHIRALGLLIILLSLFEALPTKANEKTAFSIRCGKKLASWHQIRQSIGQPRIHRFSQNKNLVAVVEHESPNRVELWSAATGKYLGAQSLFDIAVDHLNVSQFSPSIALAATSAGDAVLIRYLQWQEHHEVMLSKLIKKEEGSSKGSANDTKDEKPATWTRNHRAWDWVPLPKLDSGIVSSSFSDDATELAIATTAGTLYMFRLHYEKGENVYNLRLELREQKSVSELTGSTQDLAIQRVKHTEGTLFVVTEREALVVEDPMEMVTHSTHVIRRFPIVDQGPFVSAIDYNSEQQLVMIGLQQGTILLYNWVSEKLTKALLHNNENVLSAEFTGDDRSILVTTKTKNGSYKLRYYSAERERLENDEHFIHEMTLDHFHMETPLAGAKKGML